MAENVASTSQFNPAVIRIITAAFRNLSIIDDDEEPTGDQYDVGAYKLNSIVKTLEATGIHVWTEEEAILFFQLGIPEYLFSGTGTAVAGTSGFSMVAKCADADNWTSFALVTSYPAGTTVIELDVPAALLAGAGSIGLEGGGIIGLEGGGELGLESANYGVVVGDNIGVQLDDSSLFWTTVAAVNGADVTLASELPTSASQGSLILDYAPGVQVLRPLQIPRSRTYNYLSETLTPMTRLSRQEYMDLPQPRNPGIPTQFFYSPRRGTGRFYAWPNVMGAFWAARFTYLRPLADLLAPNNTMDFPQEWVKPCEWWLSKDLVPGYSVPPAKAQYAKEMADEMMELVLGYDRETEDVQFGIDWQLR